MPSLRDCCSFGREEKNEDNEEALSDELTADFQTRYLHRRYQAPRMG
jgi:hypothetical protein